MKINSNIFFELRDLYDFTLTKLVYGSHPFLSKKAIISSVVIGSLDIIVSDFFGDSSIAFRVDLFLCLQHI